MRSWNLCPASPKSPRAISPSSVMKMFSGFMSRCTMCSLCSCCSTHSSGNTICRERSDRWWRVKRHAGRQPSAAVVSQPRRRGLDTAKKAPLTQLYTMPVANRAQQGLGTLPTPRYEESPWHATQFASGRTPALPCQAAPVSTADKITYNPAYRGQVLTLVTTNSSCRVPRLRISSW